MATSTIYASGITNAVSAPMKTYNATTSSEVVSALNNMALSIPIDKGMAYFSLRTIDLDLSESNPFIPPGNWACLAYRYAADSGYFVVFLFSQNQKDMYMYRNLNGVAGQRYITKIEGVNTQNW